MKKILTVTMNPAIDTSSSVEKVTPDRKLRCTAPRHEPGGGGINVSRVVFRLGGETKAMYTAGGNYGDLLQNIMAEKNIPQLPVRISDATRENITIYEKAGEQQFRFGMPGPELEKHEWQTCLDKIKEQIQDASYIVASGSLPPGVPHNFYTKIAQCAKEHRVRCIIDTSGEALRASVAPGVFLLKPNLRELQVLAKETIETEKQQRNAAKKLIESGACEVVVVSMGAGGALLVTAETIEQIRTPTVTIRSKVGAGDSMVGGMVYSLAKGDSIPNAVRYGIAAGAAAVMTPGTELCRSEDVEHLYRSMTAEGD